MQLQQPDDLGFCPSFSCYSTVTQASTAAGRISIQLQQQQQQQQQHASPFHDAGDDEFEFDFVIGEDVISPEYTDSDDRTRFPLFNRDLLLPNEVEADRETRGKQLVEEEIECANSLQKLFINEREESVSSSSSSSEVDESDGDAPAVFCVWRNKADAGASHLSRCKKSSSTGSGSKRWRIRDLLRRSNSEGKEPMVLLTHKKLEVPKQKVSSGDVATVAGKLKPSSPSSPSIHELFYVQQRAKREDVKRRSYLPYRQGLVGFFSNGNVKGKKGKKLVV